MTSPKALLVLVLTATMITACGGGSNNSSDVDLKTGVFIDSVVRSLNYTTSSGYSGVTDDDGKYKYREGDTIEFFIGDISIGSMPGNELLSVFNTAEPSKVAMFLQSLDSDGNPNNGISLDTSIHDAFNGRNISINDVSQEDINFKSKFKAVTGNDFIVT